MTSLNRSEIISPINVLKQDKAAWLGGLPAGNVPRSQFRLNRVAGYPKIRVIYEEYNSKKSEQEHSS